MKEGDTIICVADGSEFNKRQQEIPTSIGGGDELREVVNE